MMKNFHLTCHIENTVEIQEGSFSQKSRKKNLSILVKLGQSIYPCSSWK